MVDYIINIGALCACIIYFSFRFLRETIGYIKLLKQYFSGDNDKVIYRNQIRVVVAIAILLLFYFSAAILYFQDGNFIMFIFFTWWAVSSVSTFYRQAFILSESKMLVHNLILKHEDITNIEYQENRLIKKVIIYHRNDDSETLNANKKMIKALKENFVDDESKEKLF